MNTPQIPKDKVENITAEQLKGKLEEGGLQKQEAANVVDSMLSSGSGETKNYMIIELEKRMAELNKQIIGNRQLGMKKQQEIHELEDASILLLGSLKECQRWIELEKEKYNDINIKTNEPKQEAK
jgi:hypothetical protein